MNSLKHSSRFEAVVRWIVGAVFLFSGIVKGIDPWGTALKIGEYFAAFGMDFMQCTAPLVAVAQCVIEALLGVLLVARRCTRLAAGAASLLLGFFTLLTLCIALFNPLDDCGCFGNALKLNNWLTFAKNVVLLPAAIFVWRCAVRRGERNFALEWIVLPAVILCAAFVGCWYWLPPVDASPLRTGVSLRSDVMCSGCIERAVVLVYEDTAQGSLHEFTLADTTWYDTSRWRYVETRSPYDDLPDEVRKYDFALWRNGRNYASEVVYDAGVTYAVVLHDSRDLTDARARKISDFIDRLDTGSAIMLMGTDSEEDAPIEIFETQKHTVPVYGIDREVAALLLRADAGVVKISDGTLAAKRHLARRNTLLKSRRDTLLK